ncbi:hypothetical protein KCH_62040 [Kitasatospora cheerisanensis KCTC 2395]|uniref:Uncharacterized protein n=1 Tax=Kitasatospora cheerisanensis KCTC 2395 TaxID=1348663 RepID=A0A066YVT2_9ACTN|nr:hypothetical protein KCH_62040 [Kitasatospora cheerisanensis KCTC 2395]
MRRSGAPPQEVTLTAPPRSATGRRPVGVGPAAPRRTAGAAGPGCPGSGIRGAGPAAAGTVCAH